MASTTAPTAAPQGTHHYVLTLDLPGRMATTWTGTLTPGTTDTRHDIYAFLRRHITAELPEYGRANVVFFALEPNQL
ncbi:hypothetical protein ACIQ9R_22640 [Streptomyces sp. NPDC094447]|uniref:hypothetical protein n=1 Tax=Streptomyces sp. NPDC094447 TaxID=3366062 RepID=UPI0038065039